METDRYGDRVEVSRHTVQRTAFAPRPNEMGRGSREFTDRADTVVSDAELYVPFGADIVATDVIEFEDGSRWEASGAVERWRGAFSVGWMPGAVVPLRRMTG
jgi:hypothetical protein